MLWDMILHALTWPRRRLRAAGLEHELRAAQLRALVEEIDRRPLDGGSMQYDADPAARHPGYLGTWTPHTVPWDVAGEHFPGEGKTGPGSEPSGAPGPAPELLDSLPEPGEDWAERLRAELHDAPYPEPARRATADEWEQWYHSPDYQQRLDAERGAFGRWLERESARFHRGLTMRRPA